MDSTKLALFGGKKLIDYDLENYKSIGEEELNAAKEVIASGVLSRFLDVGMMIFMEGQKLDNLKRHVKNTLKSNMLLALILGHRV